MVCVVFLSITTCRIFLYLFITLLLFIIYLLNFIVGLITFDSFCQLKHVDVDTCDVMVFLL